MKTLKTITALLIYCTTFGQAKTIYNTTDANGDSTFWFKLMTERARKLSLPVLDTSSKTNYVRIWTNKQVIDIWKNNNGDFVGNLTTWTDEYVGGNEQPTNRSFIKTQKLNPDTLRLLSDLLVSSHILALPTEDSIDGWQRGFDGITYFIEHSTKNKYSFKSYWTPSAQDSLKEAIQVQSFIACAFSLVNAQAVWKEFSKEIPFESYYNGGPSVAMKVLTEKERKKYRRERQNYRKQQLWKNTAIEHKSN